MICLLYTRGLNKIILILRDLLSVVLFFLVICDKEEAILFQVLSSVPIPFGPEVKDSLTLPILVGSRP